MTRSEDVKTMSEEKKAVAKAEKAVKKTEESRMTKIINWEIDRNSIKINAAKTLPKRRSESDNGLTT